MPVDEFASVIFCDDIRKEITNKDILIGVYAGNIIVPVFPAQLAMSIWIEMNPAKTGSRELAFRIVTSQPDPVEFRIRLAVSELGSIGFSIPRIPLLMQEEGEIRLEVLEGEDWRLLKSKQVKQGAVSLPFGQPAPSSS